MMGYVDTDTAREMYNKVKETGLYDQKLAMYKTSASRTSPLPISIAFSIPFSILSANALNTSAI